jgi:hypothetical protein
MRGPAEHSETMFAASECSFWPRNGLIAAPIFAGVLLCSCGSTYNDPYAQHRVSSEEVAAHNSRIYPVAAVPLASSGSYPVPPAYTASYARAPAYTSPYVPAPAMSQSVGRSQPVAVINGNRYDPRSLANPYGAGSPYKPNGLMNPYSQYGSQYSNKSWRNPYATDAPKLYDSSGKYLGKLSTNKYDPDSTSNPYGRYGNKYSPDSINNPYGAGNPYSNQPVYVAPSP